MTAAVTSPTSEVYLNIHFNTSHTMYLQMLYLLNYIPVSDPLIVAGPLVVLAHVYSVYAYIVYFSLL